MRPEIVLVPAFHDPHTIEKLDVRDVVLHTGWHNVVMYETWVSPCDITLPALDSLIIMVAVDCVDGSLHLGHDNSSFLMKRGDIAIIRPQTYFATRIDTKSRILVTYISNRLVEETLSLFYDQTRNVSALEAFTLTSDSLLSDNITALRQHMDDCSKYAAIEVNLIVRLILARIVSRYSRTVRTRSDSRNVMPLSILRKTLTFIEENIRYKISMEELASGYGCSAPHFARMFKKEMQTTLHQYIISRRIAKARTLLVETEVSIAQIAYECGFADPVHFTRLFTRAFDCPPASFRRNNRI
ncbi:hypothetical protein CQ054_21055 [Ochrobactrum sp. MYb29]|nr:hypothetical protein CQ054_21055 [Ochrobactrum sp. MYb29]TCQ72949.1 AraC-like DNA-binding protein [Ochrobactrum sp. BH3]